MATKPTGYDPNMLSLLMNAMGARTANPKDFQGDQTQRLNAMLSSMGMVQTHRDMGGNLLMPGQQQGGPGGLDGQTFAGLDALKANGPRGIPGGLPRNPNGSGWMSPTDPNRHPNAPRPTYFDPSHPARMGPDGPMLYGPSYAPGGQGPVQNSMKPIDMNPTAAETQQMDNYRRGAPQSVTSPYIGPGGAQVERYQPPFVGPRQQDGGPNYKAMAGEMAGRNQQLSQLSQYIHNTPTIPRPGPFDQQQLLDGLGDFPPASAPTAMPRGAGMGQAPGGSPASGQLARSIMQQFSGLQNAGPMQQPLNLFNALSDKLNTDQSGTVREFWKPTQLKMPPKPDWQSRPQQENPDWLYKVGRFLSGSTRARNTPLPAFPTFNR